MVGVFPVLIRDEFQQLLFDFQDVFARRQAGAVGYAEYVGIHGDGGMAERGIEDDVRRFPADARQFFQGFPAFGDPAGMGPGQDVAGLDDVFGLGIVQADGFDITLQSLAIDRPPSNVVQPFARQVGLQGVARFSERHCVLQNCRKLKVDDTQAGNLSPEIKRYLQINMNNRLRVKGKSINSLVI